MHYFKHSWKLINPPLRLQFLSPPALCSGSFLEDGKEFTYDMEIYQVSMLMKKMELMSKDTWHKNIDRFQQYWPFPIELWHDGPCSCSSGSRLSAQTPDAGADHFIKSKILVKYCQIFLYACLCACFFCLEIFLSWDHSLYWTPPDYIRSPIVKRFSFQRWSKKSGRSCKCQSIAER